MNSSQVFWFFQRVHVLHAEERIYFPLAQGLAFLARRYHLIQPEYLKTLLGPIGFPLINVEFTDGTGAIRWQKDAIPTNLYSAPTYEGVIVKAETTPADKTGFGINMSAVFKPRAVTLNLFYDVGETIGIRLTGQQLLTPPGYYCPNYVDIAVEGIYNPDDVPEEETPKKPALKAPSNKILINLPAHGPRAAAALVASRGTK